MNATLILVFRKLYAKSTAGSSPVFVYVTRINDRWTPSFVFFNRRFRVFRSHFLTLTYYVFSYHWLCIALNMCSKASESIVSFVYCASFCGYPGGPHIRWFTLKAFSILNINVFVLTKVKFLTNPQHYQYEITFVG